MSRSRKKRRSAASSTLSSTATLRPRAVHSHVAAILRSLLERAGKQMEDDYSSSPSRRTGGISSRTANARSLSRARPHEGRARKLEGSGTAGAHFSLPRLLTRAIRPRRMTAISSRASITSGRLCALWLQDIFQMDHLNTMTGRRRQALEDRTSADIFEYLHQVRRLVRLRAPALHEPMPTSSSDYDLWYVNGGMYKSPSVCAGN